MGNIRINAALKLSASFIFLSLAAPIEVHAQVLDEVVVTARKRVERLQDVPVSVTALSGDVIDKLGITNIAEAIELVPAVRIVSQALGSSTSIRGASSGSFNPGFEQTVGMYVDGAYFSRGAWNRQGQLDIDRVEVLKGPQGVLFGKNTVGGAINISSRNPTDKVEGYVKAGYEWEATDETSVEGALSGPLFADGALKGRLAVKYSDQTKGYLKNLSPRGTDGPISDQFLTRGTLLWDPTDGVSDNLKVSYIHSKTDGVNEEVVRCGPLRAPTASDPPSLNMARFFGASAEDCTPNFKNALVNLDAQTAAFLSQVTGQNVQPVNNGEKFNGLSAINTLNVALGQNSLTSVSSYIDHSQNIISEIDNTDLSFSTLDRTEDFKSFTQELRLASPQNRKLSWVAGGYFEDNNIKFHEFNSVYIAPYQGFPPSGGPAPPSGTFSKVSDQDSTSWALFGEGTYQLVSTVELSLGLRYSNESKKIRHQICVGLLHNPTCNNTADDTPVISPNITEQLLYVDKYDDDNLSPAVTLRWKPTADYMFYASFKKGFKGGGFDFETRNLPAGLTAGAPTRVDSDGDGIPDSFAYQSETMDAYEVGSKLTLAGGALQLNVAIFQNDLSNLQTSQFDGTVGFNTVNAGRARARGLEIDTRWRALTDLSFSGSLSLLDSKFLEFPGAQCPSDSSAADVTGTTPTGAPSCNIDGKKTAFAPDVAFTLSGDYVHPLSGDLSLALNLSAHWSDDYYMENNGEPLDRQSAYWRVDARIGVQTDHWGVALIGRNLTNSEIYSHMTSVPLAGPGYYFGFVEPPRTLAIEASMKF